VDLGRRGSRQGGDVEGLRILISQALTRRERVVLEELRKPRAHLTPSSLAGGCVADRAAHAAHRSVWSKGLQHLLLRPARRVAAVTRLVSSCNAQVPASVPAPLLLPFRRAGGRQRVGSSSSLQRARAACDSCALLHSAPKDAALPSGREPTRVVRGVMTNSCFLVFTCLFSAPFARRTLLST
jgi:hypothetical protein